MKIKISILIIPAFLLLLLNSCGETSNQAISQNNLQQYKPRFIITEISGLKLKRPALLYVDKEVWKLTNNGLESSYKIVSGNQNNPMYGLNAIDDKGERCTISIINDSGIAKISFKYPNKTINCKAEYDL